MYVCMYVSYFFDQMLCLLFYFTVCFIAATIQGGIYFVEKQADCNDG